MSIIGNHGQQWHLLQAGYSLIMNVNLTPKLEEMVRQKVASGLYNSASEVIREALRLLEEQDRLRALRFEELRDQMDQQVHTYCWTP